MSSPSMTEPVRRAQYRWSSGRSASTIARNSSRAWRIAAGVAVTGRTVPALFLGDRTHPVVLRVVLDLGEAQRFEHGRHVHSEAPAQPLLQAVPALHGVRPGATPGLDR